MITIQTEIEIPLEINHKMLKEAIHMTLAVHEQSGLDVTLRLTNDAEIRQLNRDFRKQDKATDVLSFNYNFVDPETDCEYLGDIIISIETALQQASHHNFTINQELSYLAIHGTLHLLGYDHQEPEKEEAMFQLQEKIFDKILFTFKEDKK